jgi:hypothetical protein
MPNGLEKMGKMGGNYIADKLITYKTETHMHTAETSACASATGAQQVEQYKALGYDTIIVTDHFFNGNTTVSRNLPWEERVELFCLGYENAKKRGDEIGLNVLFGLEYAWNGADFLAYGIDKRWLTDNPDLMEISVQEFCGRVHENGGAIVHAHPFREAGYIHEMKFLPDYSDGVEVYNAGNREKVWNERAKWYAEQYGLTQTAGSDCHHVGGDRFFATLTNFEITDISQYCEAVKSGKISGVYVPDKYK